MADTVENKTAGDGKFDMANTRTDAEAGAPSETRSEVGKEDGAEAEETIDWDEWKKSTEDPWKVFEDLIDSPESDSASERPQTSNAALPSSEGLDVALSSLQLSNSQSPFVVPPRGLGRESASRSLQDAHAAYLSRIDRSSVPSLTPLGRGHGLPDTGRTAYSSQYLHGTGPFAFPRSGNSSSFRAAVNRRGRTYRQIGGGNSMRRAIPTNHSGADVLTYWYDEDYTDDGESTVVWSFYQYYGGDKKDAEGGEHGEHNDSPAKQDDGRTFHKFMELPREIREQVYTILLESDKPIAPHMCNSLGQFHDDNQAEHNSTSRMLAITRVSRQVRAESLPVFYAINTFDTVVDTPTYLFRLQHLGRFHMIRNVDFTVKFCKGEQHSQKLLRLLLQYFEEQQAFEKEQIAEAQKESQGKAEHDPAANDVTAQALPQLEQDASKLYIDNPCLLSRSPLHLVGGLEPNFLVLHMLSTTLKDKKYNRKLVIHVPSSTLFTDYNSLVYFPSVCEGLGIQLQLVPGRDVDMVGSGFRLSWAQKYQKKDFANSTTPEDDVQVEALTKRVRAIYPDIENVPRPARRTYYRTPCKGEAWVWYTVDTAGGGVVNPHQ